MDYENDEHDSVERMQFYDCDGCHFIVILTETLRSKKKNFDIVFISVLFSMVHESVKQRKQFLCDNFYWCSRVSFYDKPFLHFVFFHFFHFFKKFGEKISLSMWYCMLISGSILYFTIIPDRYLIEFYAWIIFLYSVAEMLKASYKVES